jgi:ATP-dependent helicase/DNAse subunit B
MALKLVTGPANSGRAGEVLDAYRARIGEEPILVVPTRRDVEQMLRELARTGASLGARVVVFGGLFQEIGARCGAPAPRVVSKIQRELLVEEAVAGVAPRALRASAARPGFARAALELVRELERSMVEPSALEGALERWRPRGARGSRLREAAAIYRAYRERLDAFGRADEELAAWRAVDALRERPYDFGRTPVFAYGFDSFTPLELDALEVLAERADVDVTVSLPYERGRSAFKGVAPFYERLRVLAGDRISELDPVDAWYADESRAALHHLERGLFDGAAERVEAGGSVRLLAAGGERAEVELVAAHALALLRGGTPAGEVAVVYRDPERYASVIEQVFDAYGIPYSLDRQVPLGHTALGRGLLALLRCATRDGRAEDVFTYMRTPGLLDKPALADRVEADARKAGTRSVAEARALWKTRGWELATVDRMRRARSGAELLGLLARELDSLFAHSYERQAPRFAGHELDDPRVWTEVHRAIAGLQELAESDPSLQLDAARVHDKLTNLEIRLGERFRPDRVHVAKPEGIRARRFQAVFVCGLQEGEFPRPQPAEPFLSDDDRRALAEHDLRLPARDDELERERHLFYVCCSRAERVLALSSRFSDEEGNPQVGSFLVEEVKDLFAELPVERRTLADVTWPLPLAPTAAEWSRARALAGAREEAVGPDGLRHPEVIGKLSERRLSAGALETFADCPVKWLVDRILRPEELEPEPEALVRGSYAHSVLEATYKRLGGPVTPASLAEAEQILLDELQKQQDDFRISPRETRFRTAVRRLEFDLLRHLRREAEAGGEFEPEGLEVAFGGDGEGELPPLQLGPDGVEITGRIDRVDVRGGQAVVRDYKTGRTTFPVAKWEEKNRLQAALYMLAVRELMGLEAVAGLYVALAGSDKPRGLVREDAAPAVGRDVAKNDAKSAEEFEEQLERARERVGELAQRMRAGDVKPCPETCAWNGGCSYPSICRLEGKR